MKFTIERSIADRKIFFKGEISEEDIVRLQLGSLDRALIDDVGGDKSATAADQLLVLEMLFRRHLEQRGEHNARQ